MGVGIYAVPHTEVYPRPWPDDMDSDEYYELGYVFECLYPEFYRSYEGLEPGTRYKDDDMFEVFGSSYGGYNRVRETWAEFQDIPIQEFWDGLCPDKPLADIIHFSDCEGAIGPVAVKRLAEAFNDPELTQKYRDYILDRCFSRFEQNYYLKPWENMAVATAALASSGGFLIFS